MSRPSLCIIFEAIGEMGGIAKVTYDDVVIALNAGYRVTVVAQELDPRLQGDVEWLRLYVPPRGFLLKWASARHFMERAIGGRRFDLIHAHQPQAASMSNVFTCHFLTRVAYERGCLENGSTLRARLVRAQQQGVLHLEDRIYRHWNPRTRMAFCSDLLRSEFERLYGLPPAETVIDNACPSSRIPSASERSQAKMKLLGRDTSLPVVGYLGGLDERKGYRRLLDAVREDPNLYLLLAGPSTEEFEAVRGKSGGLGSHSRPSPGVSGAGGVLHDMPELRGRMKSCGMVRDLDTFYAACDVLAVPSLFDPNPMVVLEAVSRGVPVIAGAGVGNLHHLVRTGAGAGWNPTASLGSLVRDILTKRESYLAGAATMTEELSRERRARRMLETYEKTLAKIGRA